MIKLEDKNKILIINILHTVQEIIVKYVLGERYGKYEKDYIKLLEM